MSEPDQPHHLLLYEYVENMAERRLPHREAHLAHLRQAREAGQITLAGALGGPEPTGGAIVFCGVERAEVEAWADADPYLAAGLVRSRRIALWTLV
jgi:uncharacterized protein YciI